MLTIWHYGNMLIFRRINELDIFWNKNANLVTFNYLV